MKSDFMVKTAKIIAEIRNRTCIDDDVEVIKEILQDALNEYYYRGYDDGRSEGYADGYEVGYDEGYEVGYDEGYAV